MLMRNRSAAMACALHKRKMARVIPAAAPGRWAEKRCPPGVIVVRDRCSWDVVDKDKDEGAIMKDENRKVNLIVIVIVNHDAEKKQG